MDARNKETTVMVMMLWEGKHNDADENGEDDDDESDDV